MTQIKWFDRSFHFQTEQNIFPSILERLSGTPIRLEEKVKLISNSLFSISINNTWTIKENIGHLIDLEPLWQDRFDDILNGEVELRPTDLQNTKTDLANHDKIHIDELLLQFRTIRNQTLTMLEKIDEQIIFKSSLHPRLKTPMRTIDLFLFVAEHDDHHLARITELAKSL